MLSLYLRNRSQTVKIDRATSQPLVCDMGVPQGSILGPLLFSFIHHNLPQVCKYSKCLLCADDTMILLSDLNPTVIYYYFSSYITGWKHVIVFSTISYCLPIWSLATKEITEPIVRLYYRALKIHSNHPPLYCTHMLQRLDFSELHTQPSYYILFSVSNQHFTNTCYTSPDTQYETSAPHQVNLSNLIPVPA